VNAWKVILATLLIFGTGLVTGGLLVRHMQPEEDPAPKIAVQPTNSSPGNIRLEFLKRMQPALGLTREQRVAIDRQLEQSQARIQALMNPVQPRIKEEIEKTREAMRKELTPEQQTRFDELLKQPPRQRRPSPSREGPRERFEKGPGRTNTPTFRSEPAPGSLSF
jgi:hypothetical protein